MTEYPSIAAVDLGSNSFHLLIAREVDGRFQILHKEKQRVYLAAGLDDDFYLSSEAIERALHALKQFATTLKSFSHSHVQVVATYTLRNSKNIQHFLHKAQQCFPFKINVISGQEEARLIYQGVANYIHNEHNRLVIDIGGGSSELIIGRHFNHLLLTSRNMGCVNMTQQFFSDGKLTEKRFNKALIKAEQDLEVITASYLNKGWETCLGTSGTIKTLSAINHAYFNESHLTLKSLTHIKTLIFEQQQLQLLVLKGLPIERRSSIVGGLIVLIAIFKQLNIHSLEYCDFALREGLMHEAHQRKEFDIRARTINTLCEHYTVDTAHSDSICQTLRQFFAATEQSWQLNNCDLQILCWAAQLHEVGLTINSSGLHKHSAYIIMHSQLPGFTQEQQLLLSTLIRFYRKKIKPTDIHALFTEQPKNFAKLLTLLRLAIICNQKRQYQQTGKIELQAREDTLSIKLDADWANKHSILFADLQQEQRYLTPLNINLALI
ncbi:Ppx/GppA phosphatase family protein [Pseudoalteromonas sp. MMG012]|uniref:Ppx/GppA phosphatase family protein n=1 Tax=Pseudoalteromonas sp. MMG012 TaxID=2822686 RepID=UPI001B39E681|nr:Ppx/GppA phosphatase family protein [Pseudoalteromonas sp. MMG012]MBQ4849411.1 Ppx/GppA family phosphatase [Pseudoalteromonas sp. MMG012]